MSSIRNWWQFNVTQNPMLAEIERFRRKFFSFRGPNVQANGGLGLIVVLFLFYSIICIYNRGDVEPTGQLMVYLGFALFVVPFMLHGTIAGERERRSWDMLLVAPISPSQIVIGKLMAAFLGLLTTLALFLVPVLILAIYYPSMNWSLLIMGIGVVISQLLSLSALCILISARVRRPLIALAVSIGVVLVFFFFAPLMISSMMTFMGQFLTNSIHPFAVLTKLANTQTYARNQYDYEPDWQDANLLGLTVTGISIQLILTVALTAWAIKTLHFADNEIRFINHKKKKNA